MRRGSPRPPVLNRIAIPIESWSRSGSAAKPSHRYSDKRRTSGPITSVAVKDGSLCLKGKGGALYSLAGAPQGAVTVRLQLGNGVMLCALAPAKDPTTSNDTPTAKFTGARPAPAPATCPNLPGN